MPNKVKMFGVMLPHLPGLMIRLGGTFLRMKRQANKAGKVFKKELIEQGIDKEMAKELTAAYLEPSNFMSYVQNIGSEIPVGKKPLP